MIGEILQSLQFKIIEPIVQFVTVNVRYRISFRNLFFEGLPDKLTNTALCAIDKNIHFTVIFQVLLTLFVMDVIKVISLLTIVVKLLFSHFCSF